MPTARDRLPSRWADDPGPLVVGPSPFRDVPVAVAGDLFAAVGEDGTLLVIVAKGEVDAYHAIRTALRCEPSWIARCPDGVRPVIVETQAKPCPDVTLRLFRQSRMPGFTGRADTSLTLPWSGVEEVADLPPAERARVAFSSLSDIPDRSQRAVARMGCALARDPSFCLARFMTLSEVEALVSAEVMPRGERSFASLEAARQERAARDDAYVALRAAAPRSRALLSAIAAVEQVSSGVLCGAIAPWARWGLLHRRLRRSRVALSLIGHLLPEEAVADGALADRIFSKANAEPRLIAALCLDRTEAVAALKDGLSGNAFALRAVAERLFPENDRRLFMAVDDTGEGVRLGFFLETSKPKAKARIEGTPFARVADLGRTLSALGDHMVFGSPEPLAMAEVKAGLRAMRGPGISADAGEDWQLPEPRAALT